MKADTKNTSDASSHLWTEEAQAESCEECARTVHRNTPQWAVNSSSLVSLSTLQLLDRHNNPVSRAGVFSFTNKSFAFQKPSPYRVQAHKGYQYRHWTPVLLSFMFSRRAGAVPCRFSGYGSHSSRKNANRWYKNYQKAYQYLLGVTSSQLFQSLSLR